MKENTSQLGNYKKYLARIKQKQYEAIINSKEYNIALTDVCKRIIAQARKAPNEATIETYFDCELFALFKDIFSPLGFNYNPTKEVAVSTRRHITKGRADTAVGAVVIEFKHSSALSNKKLEEKAVTQISNYLLGMKSHGIQLGFVTDGIKCCFIAKNEGQLFRECFVKLSTTNLNRLIQAIIRLHLTALTSRNLVSNFCDTSKPDGGIAFNLVRALYQNLMTSMTPKTKMLFNEWKELFNLSHDDISKQQAIIDRRKSLEDLLQITFVKKDEEYMALFALQTAYMIIIKIVAYRIASIVRYKKSLINFQDLAQLDGDALRHQLSSLEDGDVFREYGIGNLLEGDFFSWYTAANQWTAEIGTCISKVFEILSVYADKPILNPGEKATDFFKELYQEMIPAAVRHSLGEYYTKHWLAKQVFEDALQMQNANVWKGLDPCCGSGTFIMIMINRVLEETKGQSNAQRLKEILDRVKGIDLNPVAVLTARINYFINIANLMDDSCDIEIPIYLGDSSYIPRKKMHEGILCLEYTINTLKTPINILVPASMVSDSTRFSQVMTEIEQHIKNLDENRIYKLLETLPDKKDLLPAIKDEIRKLTKTLVDLERNHWNGIWARIITNYLTTANLGKFNIIVGNPPWVDWKSLPSGYREKIKSLCISRKLFSGDRVTGGINLNICALISNVVAENWLSDDGILGFLMPEPLIFQPSYEGFRNFYLSDNSRLYFRKFTNWTFAGHPFKPVTQKFLTFYITKQHVDYKKGIDVDWWIMKKNHEGQESIPLEKYFHLKHSIAATCHETKNIFSYVESRAQLKKFTLIAGQSEYIGREGIEFYPQEMLIFTLSGLPSKKECVSLKNIQVAKSKYHVPQRVELLEKQYLHPLIKGIDIQPFHVNVSDYIVPFPYETSDYRLPLEPKVLAQKAPRLAAFYQKFKDLIVSQTQYNEKIIGKQGAFYALARVGKYSFAPHYVVFRDNTKWGAAVISHIDTDWGGCKRPLFQNHAVSISEDSQGRFISLEEAHFICGILNAPIVTQYIAQSSDSRSFPIRPRIFIPKYDSNDRIHKQIAKLSKEAHKKFNFSTEIERIRKELDRLYLTLVNQSKD